ncbi:MAG: (2Fe-2S)-binding protein [Spirochaetes bacterium]|nr:(2Fe-2S)-binding protein [Spirochaetota bacterium]
MSACTITIDGKALAAGKSETVLEVCNRYDIYIPSLCRGMGDHRASCLLCLVEDTKSGKLLPACETQVSHGMSLNTNTHAVKDMRTQSLTMLLAEHAGDCTAPCALVCPAHLETDKMVRLVEDQKYEEAAQLLYSAIPLPRASNMFCPGPCEKSCRRAEEEDGIPVSIRPVKDFLAANYPPVLKNNTADNANKKKALIIGGGPAGIAAVWYAACNGYAVTLADSQGYAGMLKAGIDEKPVIAAEIDNLVKAADASLITRDIATDDPLTQDFDILINTGLISAQMAVARAFYHGREEAAKVIAHAKGVTPHLRQKSSPSRLGKCSVPEIETLLQNRLKRNAHKTESVAGGKLCLDCTCWKSETCLLKKAAEDHKIKTATIPRLNHKRDLELVICGALEYEPAKCMRCGLCINTAQKLSEPYPLSFENRGIDTRLLFDYNLPAPVKTAHRIAQVCPIGALRCKDYGEKIDE